jgi:lycopene beta-cyclase
VKASEVKLDKVILESGEVMTASCVLDARGFQPNENVFLGYQKFVGRTIRTKEPHGLKHPIIMDATVEQLGGYRFVYCLPFTDHEVLVEDTYYTDGGELSENEVTARIEDYIAAQGWEVDKLVRSEKGVLPITLAVKDTAYRPNAIGIRGGFYHGVTGYSFPVALSVADFLAMTEVQDNPAPEEDIETTLIVVSHTHHKDEGFFRLLNRMLFRAAKPEERYKVLQRFYGLSPGIVERFYAGELTFKDKARILSGKPPVPLHKALYNFSEKAFIRRERAKRKRPK